MSDKEAGDLAETGGRSLPEPEVEQGSRWLPSLVWLIPLLAALIGAGGRQVHP
jgi:paraquat-inducible protein B